MTLIETNYNTNKIIIRKKDRTLRKHNLNDINFSRIMKYLSTKNKIGQITTLLTKNGWIARIK